MANRPAKLLPKDECLLRVQRIGETLAVLGKVAEEAQIPELADAMAQALRDITDIYATLEQL